MLNGQHRDGSKGIQKAQTSSIRRTPQSVSLHFYSKWPAPSPVSAMVTRGLWPEQGQCRLARQLLLPFGARGQFFSLFFRFPQPHHPHAPPGNPLLLLRFLGPAREVHPRPGGARPFQRLHSLGSEGTFLAVPPRGWGPGGDWGMGERLWALVLALPAVWPAARPLQLPVLHLQSVDEPVTLTVTLEHTASTTPTEAWSPASLRTRRVGDADHGPGRSKGKVSPWIHSGYAREEAGWGLGHLLSQSARDLGRICRGGLNGILWGRKSGSGSTFHPSSPLTNPVSQATPAQQLWALETGGTRPQGCGQR